jgi:hypothetical protein
VSSLLDGMSELNYLTSRHCDIRGGGHGDVVKLLTIFVTLREGGGQVLGV